MKDIVRYRADDYAERLTFKSGGQPIDIDGWTFLMTVNRRENPTDASDQVFQSVGEIVAPSTNGQADFPIAGTTDPGEYFYDVEIHDALGKTKTPKKGNFIVLQDITKSDGVHTFSGTGYYPVDGSGEFDIALINADPDYNALEFGERDGRKVLIATASVELTADASVMWLRDPVFDFNAGPHEASILLYAHNVPVTIGFTAMVRSAPSVASILNPGTTGNEFCFVQCDVNGGTDETVFSTFEDHVVDSGWWWATLRLDQQLKTIYAKHWKDGEDEPDSWAVQCSYVNVLPNKMKLTTYCRTYDLADYAWELAEIRWRRV